MREYALSQSLSLDAAHAFSGAGRVVSNWLKRRRLRRVQELDDYILADIGVSRDELQVALRLPLSLDPVWELHRQSRSRLSASGRLRS